MISTIITRSGPSIIPFQLSSTYSVPVFNFSSLASSRISSISPLFSKRRISLCSIRYGRVINSCNVPTFDLHKLGGERWKECMIKEIHGDFLRYLVDAQDVRWSRKTMLFLFSLSFGATTWFGLPQMAYSSEEIRPNVIYEVGELFEFGIQFTYLLILLGLLGVGSFFVIRQVLVRRELDLSAKELQEQVRSGEATATEYFELGAVMLRRKFYPAAIKYLQQAIDKWDGDSQDVAQVYNALGVSYVRDGKLDKGITQFENAVKQQPGYVTAWNNLGDAYEQKKELTKALNAFEEVLLFDPNNKMARPRRDALKERVKFYKGVPLKPEER